MSMIRVIVGDRVARDLVTMVHQRGLGVDATQTKTEALPDPAMPAQPDRAMVVTTTKMITDDAMKALLVLIELKVPLVDILVLLDPADTTVLLDPADTIVPLDPINRCMKMKMNVNDAQQAP